uniref:Uncharacterized protein n=1 Tax=Populus alba TaxID=43335 RepID=A0A4U5PYN6_POPAL|nr:hypothetical protein D5086_0000163720 [Populus alba]
MARAIRRVIMNHQSNGQSPASTFYLIKCVPSRSRGLLHVLALELLTHSLATPRPARSPTPDENEGPRRARKSFLSSTSGSTGTVAGGRPRAGNRRSASKSKDERHARGPVLAGFRSTGTRAPLLGSPRAPGEARGGEGQLHIQFHRSGYAAQEPRLAARHPGLGLRVMGSRPTVRCTSTELPTRTAQLPLMRLCVHATTIPTSEPRPTRANGNTRERSCPHRWTRKDLERDKQHAAGGLRRISKGQATSRGGRGGSRRDTQQAAGDAADLEGTGRGGVATGTIIRGAICLSSEDGGQASGSGHIAQELGDGEESQHLGTSAATECGTPTRYSSPRNPQAQRSAPDTSASPPACEHRQRPCPLPSPCGRRAKPLGAVGAASTLARGESCVKAPHPRPRIKAAPTRPTAWSGSRQR